MWHVVWRVPFIDWRSVRFVVGRPLWAVVECNLWFGVSVVRCALLVAGCCVLFVACCFVVLLAVCCSLVVVCCLLCVVCWCLVSVGVWCVWCACV